MLRLGDTTAGRTWNQDWEGTAVSYVILRGERQVRVRLNKPIKSKDGESIAELVVGRRHVDPAIRRRQNWISMDLTKYTVRWHDPGKQDTEIFAHWAEQHPDSVKFFLWRQMKPLAVVEDRKSLVRSVVVPEDGFPIVWPVEDPRPNPKPICPRCATWVCTSCYGYHRPNANRSIGANQLCNRCGEDKGRFEAIRHHNQGRHLGSDRGMAGPGYQPHGVKG